MNGCILVSVVNVWVLICCSFSVATSPARSAQGSDRVQSPEQQHRKAMEYEEDEEPGSILQITEVDVTLPNIPVPKSSNEDVSK